jgi:hypothetical protein
LTKQACKGICASKALYIDTRNINSIIIVSATANAGKNLEFEVLITTSRLQYPWQDGTGAVWCATFSSAADIVYVYNRHNSTVA